MIFEYEIPKFGDNNYIDKLKRKRKIDKTKITIDANKLMKIGLSKSQAENLIQRLINLKK
jgi:hypothetical protein